MVPPKLSGSSGSATRFVGSGFGIRRSQSDASTLIVPAKTLGESTEDRSECCHELLCDDTYQVGR